MSRLSLDTPVIWLDLKGGTYHAPCKEPLEVGVLISRGLSEIVHKASEVFAYGATQFRAIKKTAHVSCLQNGLLDEVEEKSRKFDEPKEVWAQAKDFWDREVRANLPKTIDFDVWMPIWKADYEQHMLDRILKGKSNLSKRVRVVEMKDVSAFAVDVFGLDHPERAGGWRSVESLEWYFHRTRQLFGVETATNRFAG